MKLISFRLGVEWFAIDAGMGLKVTRHTGLTPIAASPPYIAGIASINGQVATVLHLEEILQISTTQSDAERRCIILKPEKAEEHLTGFMADVPVDIVECRPDEVKSPFQVKENAVTPYVKGLLAYQGEVLRILDMDAILVMKRGEKE